MPRPKKVSDQELLQAAYDIIMDHGLAGLTFGRLGDQVGLVPAAIARRFTTKKNLLAQVDRYSLQRSMAALQNTKERHDSPIEAIIAGMVTELSFATSLTRFVNGQAFLLHVFTDDQLSKNYRHSFEERRRQLIELVKEAQDKQQITRDVDPHELAVLLQTVQHGTGHVWAVLHHDSIKSYIEYSVRLLLRPYMITTKK